MARNSEISTDKTNPSNSRTRRNILINSYRVYMNSEQWLQTKTRHVARLLKNNNVICEVCHENTLSLLNIYHKSYENMGKETHKDLVCLCFTCQKMIKDVTAGMTWTSYPDKKFVQALAKRFSVNLYKNRALYPKRVEVITFFIEFYEKLRKVESDSKKNS